MNKNVYNKKIFALLLERAKGERSWRKFALDCDISYVQMRKLAMCGQDNPPRAKLLTKLGNHSECGVTTEDFFCAAGIDSESQPVDDGFSKKLNSLNPRQRREVEDFVDFLLTRINC